MSNLLTSLYTEIYGPIDAPGKLKNLTELAATLSTLAAREKPWSGRYLNGVIMGHSGINSSAELNQAIEILAGQLDGQAPLQARARPMQLLVVNGITPGSVVLGHSVRCPGCQTPIVPRVPWQKYCTRECRDGHYKQQRQAKQ